MRLEACGGNEGIVEAECNGGGVGGVILMMANGDG
jgi:hypothetical protein